MMPVRWAALLATTLLLLTCLGTAASAAEPGPTPTEGEATPSAEPEAPAPEPEGEKAPAPEAGEEKAPAPGEKKAEEKKAEGTGSDEGDEGSSGEDELEKLIEKAQTGGGGLDGWSDKAAEKPVTYPWFEHHGYFRFRADLFFDGHLSTVVPGDAASGTSAIKAPLRENRINNDGSNPFNVSSDDSKIISGANIRFRYSPTIHISRGLRIHATFDVLDNLLLGSTPDFAGTLVRPDVPLSAFATSQVSPVAGVNGFQDAIAVKEAYAEWQPAFLLRVGRMKSDWGLGILANGGGDPDDDYGDYADRAMLLFKLYGVYIAAAWDYPYIGATTRDPTEYMGQPKDLGQDDDVHQWVLSFFQRPLTAAEKEQRKVDLAEGFKPTFDWGFYGVYRMQDLDLDADSYQDYIDRGGKQAYNDLVLIPRRAWAFIPDLWLRYEQRFNYFEGLRIELEAAVIYGQVENALDDSSAGSKDRELLQVGAALEVEYQHEFDAFQLGVGLDIGAASGDDADGFGVEDRPTLSEPDGSPNTRLTNFKFDRNYHVDLILFREVIGTVTNAVYIKPWVSFDFFTSVEEALGVRVDLMYAQALEPQATPGNDGFLGFEGDLRLFYHDKGRFQFDLEAGFLFPGAAFDWIDPATDEVGAEADFAFTIQSRFTLLF